MNNGSSIAEQVTEGVEKVAPKISETVFEKVKGLFSGNAKELTDAQARVKELEGSVAEQTKTIAAKDAEIKKLQDAAAKADTDHKAALEAKEKEIGSKVNLKAREALSKAGHQPIAEEDANGTAGKSKAELWAEYGKIEDGKEKRAFYLKHKGTLNS